MDIDPICQIIKSYHKPMYTCTAQNVKKNSTYTERYIAAAEFQYQSTKNIFALNVINLN